MPVSKMTLLRGWTKPKSNTEINTGSILKPFQKLLNLLYFLTRHGESKRGHVPSFEHELYGGHILSSERSTRKEAFVTMACRACLNFKSFIFVGRMESERHFDFTLGRFMIWVRDNFAVGFNSQIPIGNF